MSHWGQALLRHSDFLPVVEHLLAEEGTEDDVHIVNKRIVVQIVEVYAVFVGEDHRVIVLDGLFIHHNLAIPIYQTISDFSFLHRLLPFHKTRR